MCFEDLIIFKNLNKIIISEYYDDEYDYDEYDYVESMENKINIPIIVMS